MDWDRRSFLQALVLAGAWPHRAWSAAPAATAALTMVYADAYPPLSFLDQGRWRGILVDLAREALEQGLGLAVEHLGFPWRRAQLMVQGGQADGFVTVPTAERLEYAAFTREPLYQARAAIAYSRRSRFAAQLGRTTTLDELKLLSHSNYFGNGWAAQNLRGFDVEWSSTLELALGKLARHRREVCIDNFPSLYYAVQTSQLKRELLVRPLTELGFVFPIHLGLRYGLAGYAEILARLDAWNTPAERKTRAQRVHARYLVGIEPAQAALLY